VLRFICASIVIIFHYQHFLFTGEVNSARAIALRSHLPLYAALRIIYDYGLWAVQIFWTISGFIFFRQYGKLIKDRKIGFAKFGLYRFSRLYPLHFLTLVLVSLLQIAYFHSHRQFFIYYDTERGFLAQLLFASSWLRRQGFSFNGPVWSVSVEIVIYCLFFVVARLIGTRPLMAIVVSAFFLALSQYDTFTPVNPWVWQCGAFFFAGGATYWVVQRATFYRLLILATLSATACICAITLPMGTLVVLPISITVLLFFATIDHNSLAKLALLGNATYSSYLCHFPIQLSLVLLFDSLSVPRTVFLSLPFFICYLAIIFAVSFASFHYFEHPAQTFIRNVGGKLLDRVSPKTGAAATLAP